MPKDDAEQISHQAWRVYGKHGLACNVNVGLRFSTAKAVASKQDERQYARLELFFGVSFRLIAHPAIYVDCFDLASRNHRKVL